jgi:HEAT repeat protein
MPRAFRRLAAPLLAVLASAGCASTGGEETAPDETAAREAAAKAAVIDKPLLYQRLNSMTQSWASAYAESGEGAAAEARALETAIAREVWARFDEVLEDLRSSDNPRWRAGAARGLGFVANPRIRPALEHALTDTDTGVLCGALVSLGRIAEIGTDDRAVARLLSYPDRVAQGNAALCLARVWQSRRLQGVQVVSPATRIPGLEVDLTVLLFNREDPIVRANAAQALGALGSTNGEDSLLNVLRDEHALVRLKAAQALALTGTRRCMDFLLDALGREGEKSVRTVLALAVGAVAEREGHVPPYAELQTDAAKWRKWLQR